MKFSRSQNLSEVDTMCIQCPDTQPVCPPCGTDQKCGFVTQTCDACASTLCQDKSSSVYAAPDSGEPISASRSRAFIGLIVGGGCALAIILALCLYIWVLRRRLSRLRGSRNGSQSARLSGWASWWEASWSVKELDGDEWKRELDDNAQAIETHGNSIKEKDWKSCKELRADAPATRTERSSRGTRAERSVVLTSVQKQREMREERLHSKPPQMRALHQMVYHALAPSPNGIRDCDSYRHTLASKQGSQQYETWAVIFNHMCLTCL